MSFFKKLCYFKGDLIKFSKKLFWYEGLHDGISSEGYWDDEGDKIGVIIDVLEYVEYVNYEYDAGTYTCYTAPADKLSYGLILLDGKTAWIFMSEHDVEFL